MVIGKENPAKAKVGSLKDAIRVGLDEALTALEECFCDLADDQVWGFPLGERHNITTLVMHCLENLDIHTCRFQDGTRNVEKDARFSIWSRPASEIQARQKGLPTVREMLHLVRGVRAAAEKALEPATDRDLLGARAGRDWCKEHGRNAAEAYWRTICHTHAHVRQIWALRGVLKAVAQTGNAGWPAQHYA